MKKKLNILALSPHADDVEIAMGGTIAKYVDEGHNVTIMTAILPKENKEGKIDDFMSKNRVKEQENSAKILGAKIDILDLDPYDFSFNRKYIKMFKGIPAIQFPKNQVPQKSDRLLAKTRIPKVVDGDRNCHK